MGSTLDKIFSRHFEIFFFLFFPEKRFDIPCKLSPLKTICQFARNVKTGFLGKKKKNISKCYLLNFLHRVLSVNKVPCRTVSNTSEYNFHLHTISTDFHLLILSMLENNVCRQHFEIFFLFFPENRLFAFHASCLLRI